MGEERSFEQGDILRHFKRETVDASTTRYLYKVVGVAQHSETKEKLMVYQALYDECGLYVRPLEMFMSEVDHAKYPDIRQRWRFDYATPEDRALV